MWNYNGRAMELSDLKMYNGKLLTVDDKTGVMYMWVFPPQPGIVPFSGYREKWQSHG